MKFSICLVDFEGSFAHFLYDICKYICYGIESAGHDCCIVKNSLDSEHINILVGSHRLTDPIMVEKVNRAGKYILFQTEIITGDTINHWSVQKAFAEVHLPLMRNASSIWTGAVSKNRLQEMGIESEIFMMGYHPSMEEIIHKRSKDIDFLFLGSMTPHRKKLIEELRARGGMVVSIFDDAAVYRNDLIARTRVHLAPNQGPGMNQFGGSRALYLINNRSIVVVERCHDQGMFEHCFPSTDTDQWVDLCMETLRRPDLAQITEEYYERFKKIRMVDFIEPLLEKYFAKLKSSSPVATSIYKDNQIEPTISVNAGNPLNPQFKQRNAIVGLTSIIILTHNRLDQTKKCVKSIRNHTPETHEIIFVDNGSTDGTIKWLQGQVKENKSFHLIENKENVGLAIGRNQGINISQGEFILLMDNDVVVSQGWLTGMLECLSRTPAAGIVGPMTNNCSGLQQVMEESYRSVDYLDRYAAKIKEQYRHRQIPYRNIAGFCMLFKRTLTEKIGLLDERFGMGHFEDEDFCLRASLEGYRNYIAGDVFIHHHGGKEAHNNRSIINKKWMISTASPEGKKLAVMKATELADDLYQKGKTDQAVEALIDCIKVVPDAKEIYYSLVRIFIETKRFSEAWEVIDSMPDAARNELKGLECIGYVKEGLGQDDEAAAYADRMITENGNYPAALNLRGVLAYKKEEKERAVDYFKKAVDADPGYGEAYTNLGVLYWGMDKKDEALVYLRKGFILSPTMPDASSLYYSVVPSSGIFSDAESDFREASKLYPNNKNISFLHIDTLIQQDNLPLAITEIENAIDAFGPDEGTLNAALVVREKIGPRHIEKSPRKNTLSLCMIVKNEEKHLAKCLKSVRDIVDEMIIVDTGSTDKTIDIANVFGANVFDFPWTGDFSAARNHSLQQAAGDWILILDADEVISARDFDELKALIRKRSSSPAAYSIFTRNYVDDTSMLGWVSNKGEYPEELGRGWIPSPKVRLFTRRENVYFSYPVHELLEASLADANIPVKSCNIIVHHYGKLEQAASMQKGEAYYLMGRMKLDKDPTNCNHIQELSRQALGLGRYEEAIDLSLKLIDLAKTDPAAKAYMSMNHPLKLNAEIETYVHLTSAYLMIERYEEALSASQRAWIINPNIKEVVQSYANCEVIAGSVHKAYTALHDLLLNEPDYPPALLLLAVVFCLKGQIEMMQNLFKILLTRGFNITPAMNLIAQRFYVQKRINEAQLILRTMIENKLSDVETGNLLESVQKVNTEVKDFIPLDCHEVPRPDSG